MSPLRLSAAALVTLLAANALPAMPAAAGMYVPPAPIATPKPKPKPMPPAWVRPPRPGTAPVVVAPPAKPLVGRPTVHQPHGSITVTKRPRPPKPVTCIGAGC